MPDRVTKEERQVSLAIEKARELKSMLTHKIHEEVPTDEKYGEPEEVKVKRPKAQNASKITNQTQKKEGYGLAGDSLKKAKGNDDFENFKVDGKPLFDSDANEKFFRENQFNEDEEIWSDNSRIRDFRNIRAEMHDAIKKVAKKHGLNKKETSDELKRVYMFMIGKGDI